MGLFNDLFGAVGSLFGGGQQTGLAKEMMSQANPFGPYRAQYAGQLGSLMSNPTSFLQNPLYQASLDQGMQAVTRGMGPMIGSGNEAAALMKYGQSSAWSELTSQEKFLAELAGANITPNFGAAAEMFGAGAGSTGIGLGGIGSLFDTFMGMFGGGGGAAAGTAGAGSALGSIGGWGDVMSLISSAAPGLIAL